MFDDKDKSKYYLDYFIGLNIPVKHYNNWFRLKYYHLLIEHDMRNLVDEDDFINVMRQTVQSSVAKDERLGWTL